MRLGRLLGLVLVVFGCTNPVPLTAAVQTAATQDVAVGGRAQLVVQVTNTGPLIPHLGLVFMTADKWYEHHTVSDLGGCSVSPDASAFDCGNLDAGATASFTIVGIARDAGSFHYELALRQLVRPFDYVNDHPNGAEVQRWDETIAAS